MIRFFKKRNELAHKITRLTATVEKHPTKIKLLKNLGDLYLKANDRKKAASIYLHVGDAYKKGGFYFKAISVYKQALKIDERWTEPHERLAEIYDKQLLFREAILHYQHLAELAKKSGNREQGVIYKQRISELSISLDLTMDSSSVIKLKVVGDHSPRTWPHQHGVSSDIIDLKEFIAPHKK